MIPKSSTRNRMLSRKAAFCGLVLCLVLGMTAPLMAHKVMLFCEADEGTVCCRAWFGKRSPARGVVFTVKDKSGRVIFTGKSDNQGRACFKTKAKPPLFAIVDAGGGHKNKFEIEAD